jgi:lipopolysaccharide/colanic/teichoic acid biosynthesis glycosyltransferase
LLVSAGLVFLTPSDFVGDDRILLLRDLVLLALLLKLMDGTVVSLLDRLSVPAGGLDRARTRDSAERLFHVRFLGLGLVMLGLSGLFPGETSLPSDDLYAIWALHALATFAGARLLQATSRRSRAGSRILRRDLAAGDERVHQGQLDLSPLSGGHRLTKGVFDRSMALALIVLLAPLLALIALAVTLTSPGPSLFVQPRYGLNRRIVRVYKFRTLHADQCDSPDANTIKPVARLDERVTPIGRFLRRTSLDELPQLFNVLQGEMSLVGPRPHAIPHDEFFAARLEGYWERYRLKPGLTGWAQVNGLRGEIRELGEMRDRLAHDLHYIENWSIWFDIRIVLLTATAVLRHEKAY